MPVSAGAVRERAAILAKSFAMEDCVIQPAAARPVLPARVDALFSEDETDGSAKAYLSDLKRFTGWCRHHDENPLPEEAGGIERVHLRFVD